MVLFDRSHMRPDLAITFVTEKTVLFLTLSFRAAADDARIRAIPLRRTLMATIGIVARRHLETF
jgi:hypothetical protein